jgi:TPP-dependent pyruvate/acetoin dehydrogenase alpha subunit
MTPEQLTAQEDEIKALWEAGELPWLTHLMGGNEEWLCRYFENHYEEGDWVFASHRCHFHYALAGNMDLIEKVKAGKSMFLYSPRFVCSAIVGGVLSIACGKALAAKRNGTSEHVHVFCGDGATDQGAFWEAARFAEARELPITFIIEDNGSQCGVSRMDRWGEEVWNLEPELMFFSRVKYYRYEPKYPHAGTVDEKGIPTRPPIKWPIERKSG